ncbi:MAG TPA: DNA-processing protein DprA [Bacillota bacterium]|nr:DNA-processing protein DprA [Bacillota bacterium]
MSRFDPKTACLSALAGIPGVRYELFADIDWSAEDLANADFYLHLGLAPLHAGRAAQAVAEFDLCVADQELERCGSRMLTVADPDYPAALRHIYNPPWALYVKGNLQNHRLRIGVVGSRKATPYGRQAVETLVPALAGAEAVVVSGLARGIDTLAHVVTLRHSGITLAVLGTGLDSVYPTENARLAQRILERDGALISEYREGTPPLPHHFPARNRIISGLSRAVLVVEGDRNSGSLITAEHAMEQGRDVCAVPGSIFSPQSYGPNWLISQGAIPVTGPESLLQALGIAPGRGESEEKMQLSFEQSSLLDIMGHEPRDVDFLVLHSSLAIGELLALLTELELGNVVSRLAGGRYIVNRPRNDQP